MLECLDQQRSPPVMLLVLLQQKKSYKLEKEDKIWTFGAVCSRENTLHYIGDWAQGNKEIGKGREKGGSRRSPFRHKELCLSFISERGGGDCLFSFPFIATERNGSQPSQPPGTLARKKSL